MISTTTGITYDTYALAQRGNFIPAPVFASVMNASYPHPYRLVQNRRYTRLPSGRRLLLTRKSSRSRTVEPSPKGAMNPHTLKPSTQGMERRMINAMLAKTAFLTEQPVRSVAKDTIFWKTAMTVDAAAKDIKRKNKVPQNRPPAMWLNTFGRVMKIRLGPCPGSIPYAKHAGKMIRPAIKATKVSNTITLTASPVRLRSLPI